MNQEQFINQISTNFTTGLELVKRKNCDYGNSNDPFQNFRGSSALGISIEKGIALRMQDKMARIGNLLQRDASVTDEKIEDTLLDLANYSNILLTYLQSQKNDTKEI